MNLQVVARNPRHIHGIRGFVKLRLVYAGENPNPRRPYDAEAIGSEMQTP